MTDEQIRSWLINHEHPSFSYFTFAVLDEETVKNKTCRIGYRDCNELNGEKMLITDFWAMLRVRVPLEVCTMSWWSEAKVGTGEVYNRECIESEVREFEEKYNRE